MLTTVGAAVAIDGALTLNDADSSEFMSARVTISANYVPGEDVLDFTDTATIQGYWDSAGGVLTLTGTDGTTNYETALQAVTYQNLNYKDPSTMTRTVTFVVNDGTDDSTGPVETSHINVASVNDAPILTAGGTADYEAGDAPVAVDPGTVVTDWDDVNLQSATVTITNVQTGDVLDYTMGRFRCSVTIPRLGC